MEPVVTLNMLMVAAASTSCQASYFAYHHRLASTKL